MRCNFCDSYFTQNIIDKNSSRYLYTHNKYNKWATEDFILNKTANLLKNISFYVSHNKTILDIGCNSGEFLDYAKSKGAITYGVEYSTLGRKILSKKGHKVYNLIEDVPRNKKFDVITAFDLVEHLYDINKFLENCRYRLKKEGVLMILTGNPNCLSAKLSRNKWWYARFPEHIIFPSKKYFVMKSKFKLMEYIPVFNSKAYSERFLLSRKIKSNFLELGSKILKFSYDGLPLIDKDHVLIVLRR